MHEKDMVGSSSSQLQRRCLTEGCSSRGDVSFISNPLSQYGGYPGQASGNRRKKCVDLRKHKNPSAFRRSAQPPGTLSVDPKSNCYIPRNLLGPVNHVSWSVEVVTHPPTIHHSSLLTLYTSFISPTKTPMPTRFTACKSNSTDCYSLIGYVRPHPITSGHLHPDLNVVRIGMLTYPPL